MINDTVGVKYTSAEMTKYGIKTIDEAIKSFKVPVVELHDSASMKRTPAALEGILKYYKARGYSFKGLEDYTGTGNDLQGNRNRGNGRRCAERLHRRFCRCRKRRFSRR